MYMHTHLYKQVLSTWKYVPPPTAHTTLSHERTIIIIILHFLYSIFLATFLELDESHHSERTVFIPPPEAGTNQVPIMYKSFKLNPDLMRPQKNFCLKNPSLSAFGIVPGSPMARRTKQEIKVAQRMARKQVYERDDTLYM